MSTPEQMKGDSLRRQLAKTRRYAEDQHLDLIESFDDLGVSAFRGSNAELGALATFKKLVEDGDIEPGSYLIVESMDRLSRQRVMDAFLQLADIVRRGIHLVTLDDGQTYSEKTLDSEPFKLFIALGAMARAHEESRRKSGLLSDAWTGKREKLRSEGKLLTSVVPAWLKANREKNEIVPIPERVKVVNEIFTLARDGYGFFSIAKSLNARRLKPWSGRKNAVWGEAYIQKILRNRAVLGECQPYRAEVGPDRKRRNVPVGDPIPNYYPAVVTPLLFQEATQAAALRKKFGKGRKGKSYANLFTGLLKCQCSAGMRHVDKGPPPKNDRYLRCAVALAGSGDCRARGFKYEVIESTILNAIKTLDINKVLGGHSRRKRLTDLEHHRSMLRVDLEAIERKINRIVEVVTAGDKGPTPGILKEKLRQEEAAQRKLIADIEAVDIEIESLLSLNPEARKKAIADLLVKIRAKDKPEAVERSRRALAGELQRLIEKITVVPYQILPFEIIENDPDWQKRYSVGNEQELEELLNKYPFELRIKYQNGDYQNIEGPKRAITYKMTPQMKRFKTKIASSDT